MITVNKEEKRIDISGENYLFIKLFIDNSEYLIPISGGEGCLTNIQTEMNVVEAYGMTEIAVG